MARTRKDEKKKAADGLIEVYEGRDVLQTTIQITNAGDGLSEALQVDPRVMHHGEKVYLVLECDVAKVSYPPIKDTDCLQRMHTLKAGRATFVEADLVMNTLNQQHVRITEALDARRGQGALDMEAASLAGDHVLGEHRDGLVEGCPKCDAEREAEEHGN